MEKPSAPACFTKSTALGSSLANSDWKGTSWKLSTSVNGAPLSCTHIGNQSITPSSKRATNVLNTHTHTHTHTHTSSSVSCTHISNQSVTPSSKQPINVLHTHHQSINHSVKHATNQQSNQSISQSISREWTILELSHLQEHCSFFLAVCTTTIAAFTSLVLRLC